MNEITGNRYLRDEYVARINRVIDHIEMHLDGELSLGALAEVARFSQYHFHRIFRGIVGESLSQFIQRLRLERAAGQLAANPKKQITRIAYDCGFGSSASFARAFRELFDMSPTEWRAIARNEKSKNGIPESKIRKTESKEGKDGVLPSVYLDGITRYNRRIEMVQKGSKESPLNVEVRDLPDMHVAYVRHIGPYQGNSKLFDRLFTKLFTWAGARDLLRFPETRVLAVYHDNPDITEGSRLRTSVCVTVPENTPVEGEIGLMTVPGGRYAVGHFELSNTEYEAAWDRVFGEWLPASGFQPDDRPCFEMFLNDADTHPEHKHVVDICVPVKPL